MPRNNNFLLSHVSFPAVFARAARVSNGLPCAPEEPKEKVEDQDNDHHHTEDLGPVLVKLKREIHGDR